MKCSNVDVAWYDDDSHNDNDTHDNDDKDVNFIGVYIRRYLWLSAACPANCKTCAWDKIAVKLRCTQCYDSYQRTDYGTCDCTCTSLRQIGEGLTPSTLAFPNSCCAKGSVPYWSNPPFLIFDIWALWRSVVSARAPECQRLKMVG